MNRVSPTYLARWPIVVLVTAALAVACNEFVAAPRTSASDLAGDTLSAGDVMFTTMRVRGGQMSIVSSSMNRASITLTKNNAPRMSFERPADFRPSLDSGTVTRFAPLFDAAPKHSAPRSAKHLVYHAIADRMQGGKRVTILAVDADKGEDKKPPQAFITLIDGKLVDVTLMNYTKVRGQWTATSMATTGYDAHGAATLIAVVRYTANGRVSSSWQERVFGRAFGPRLAVLGEAAADALLPARVQAQNGMGPCGVLYDIMIAAGAAAADAEVDAAEAGDLCEESIVTDIPAVVAIVCGAAATAEVYAAYMMNEASMANADYIMCVAESVAFVLPEIVIIGSPPDDCYDYDVWVSDPDQEDMGWWETQNSCEPATQ